MNVNVDLMEEIVIQVNGGIMINVDVSVCEKYYVWNPATCNCENGKYLVKWMIQRLCVIKLEKKQFQQI